MLHSKFSVFKKTRDKWCDNFCIQMNGNYFIGEAVEVNFHQNISTDKEKEIWRVSVWGTDDFGMEIDLKSKEEAAAVFFKVIQEEFVSVDHLISLGFLVC